MYFNIIILGESAYIIVVIQPLRNKSINKKSGYSVQCLIGILMFIKLFNKWNKINTMYVGN